MALQRRSPSGSAHLGLLLLALLALLPLAPARLARASEEVSLVRDITPGPGQTILSPFGVLGDTFLFRAGDLQGSELWRSDGTEAGTTLVSESVPGPEGSNPGRGVLFGGKLYFSSNRPYPGSGFGISDLWRTDGTTAGTELVKDLGGGSMRALASVGGALFFIVRPAGGGPETIWRSDGTAAGTGPIDVGPTVFGDPLDLLPAASQIYFVAPDGAGIRNLFRTDGTPAGTRQLTRFTVNQSFPFDFDPTVVDDRLYFSHFEEATGVELWTSDGTAAGTGLVGELAPGSKGIFVGARAPFNGKLVFAAFGFGGATLGGQLLITDGTAEGTRILANFIQSSPAILAEIDGRLYFQADGNAIWVTDGTSIGTRQFLDLGPILAPPLSVVSLFSFKGATYFIAWDGSSVSQIWRVGGAAVGATLVAEIVTTLDDEDGAFSGFWPTAVGDTLFFFAADDRGAELWKLVADDGPLSERVSDGLLALYAFDEGAGTTVYDRSGVAPPLDLQLSRERGATWVADGLRLNGSNSLFSAGPASKVISGAQASNALTIEAWVTPADVEQFSARIVTISGSATRRNVSLIHGVFDTRQPTVASARIRTTRSAADGGRPLLAPEGSLAPRLTHLVFTRAADGTMRLFVDGQEVARGRLTGSLSSWDPTYRLALGGEIPSRRYWNGTYHLVAIYGRALDGAEVGQNFAAGPGAPDGR